MAMHFKRSKSLDKPRICPECGKEFLPRTNFQKFCSRDCQKRHNNKNRRRNPLDKELIDGWWTIARHPRGNVDKLEEEARKLGMSYGKYQAWKRGLGRI